MSYVINGTGSVAEITRERVLAAIAELRYQPRHAARSLRGASRTMGIPLGVAPGQLADPVVAEVIAGFAAAAAQRGYDVLLIPIGSGDDLAACARAAGGARADGFAVLDVRSDDERVIALAEAGVPYVCAGGAPDGYACPIVQCDVAGGAEQAMRHLLALGHRAIALIQAPGDRLSSDACFAGYATALGVAHVPLDPSLVVEAGSGEAHGYLAMQELLSAEAPPTAVLAGSDELAFGAMHAIREAGWRIGDDISLVGLDDVPLAAHVEPPLTAVRQPRAALGSRLAMVLDACIRAPDAPITPITLDTRLMIRRSTAPPTARIG